MNSVSTFFWYSPTILIYTHEMAEWVVMARRNPKMPPWGFGGLEGLVTYKYQLWGNGQIAATYTGQDSKSFTHPDL